MTGLKPAHVRNVERRMDQGVYAHDLAYDRYRKMRDCMVNGFPEQAAQYAAQLAHLANNYDISKWCNHVK